MGRLIQKRDRMEADLQDVIEKIDYFINSCSKWRNDLSDTYHNDSSWYNSASQWLRNEVKVTIEWLDYFIEWGDHFIKTLQKIYDAISGAYDKYTEANLNSTPDIEIYMDKAYKRCKIAYEWYDMAVEAYENFDKVLSGKYDVDSIDRIIKYDNQLFNAISDKQDEYDDNSDHYWKEK